MRRIAVMSAMCLLLMRVLSVNTYMQAMPDKAARLPVPCIITPPRVYLVIEDKLRLIVDWDTFLSLGYKSTEIVPCGKSATLPEGAPITKLIKGSSDPVYWMEDGVRRHIPDMATFDALGLPLRDITVLPDSVVALWPLGDPLPARR